MRVGADPPPRSPDLSLDLCLDIGETQVTVRARAVRVQERAWGRMGGIGAAFEGLDRATTVLVESRLAELEVAGAAGEEVRT